mmetsp:Transcript_104914/g.296796  ORF Transcript_104914/g.296796 Transcript_104914/m.296796 type:complete len:309 (+) Transcript_104914:176-1102(+)
MGTVPCRGQQSVTGRQEGGLLGEDPAAPVPAPGVRVRPPAPVAARAGALRLRPVLLRGLQRPRGLLEAHQGTVPDQVRDGLRLRPGRDPRLPGLLRLQPLPVRLGAGRRGEGPDGARPRVVQRALRHRRRGPAGAPPHADEPGLGDLQRDRDLQQDREDDAEGRAPGVLGGPDGPAPAGEGGAVRETQLAQRLRARGHVPGLQAEARGAAAAAVHPVLLRPAGGAQPAALPALAAPEVSLPAELQDHVLRGGGGDQAGARLRRDREPQVRRAVRLQGGLLAGVAGVRGREDRGPPHLAHPLQAARRAH